MSNLLHSVEKKIAKQVSDISQKLTTNTTSVIDRNVALGNSKASSTFKEIKAYCISSFAETANVITSECKWAIDNSMVASEEFKVSLFELTKEQFANIATTTKEATKRAAKTANDESLIVRHFPDIRDSYESELGSVISTIEAEIIARNNKNLKNLFSIAFNWLLKLLGKAT